MKRKSAISILIICMMITLWIPRAMAAPVCTEPLPDLFQRVSPSVVYISAVTIDTQKMANRVSGVIGSGFIIDNKGLVMTNAHVVFGRQVIVVTLDDGEKVQAKLLGADPVLDIALLRIPVPAKGHPKATLGKLGHHPHR